jgi:hypothetical protein
MIELNINILLIHFYWLVAVSRLPEHLSSIIHNRMRKEKEKSYSYVYTKI